MLGQPLRADQGHGEPCAPCQLLDSFTCTEGDQSTVAPCSQELGTLMEHGALEGCSPPGRAGALLHAGQGTELWMFLMEKH